VAALGIVRGVIDNLALFLARHDFDCRGAGPRVDHRAEVWAVMVLRPVGVVDAAVDRSVHRLEGDLLRHPGGDYPSGRLPHRGLIPTRILPVLAAHVEGVVDRDGPNPRRGAIRNPIFTER
jgi:hypothetical protein